MIYFQGKANTYFFSTFTLCKIENIKKKVRNIFSVAKATLESQMSVCTSVTETPQPLRIAPIGHQAYQPLSLSTIKPIDMGENFFRKTLSFQ